jgi:hypothetical protein
MNKLKNFYTHWASFFTDNREALLGGCCFRTCIIFLSYFGYLYVLCVKYMMVFDAGYGIVLLSCFTHRKNMIQKAKSIKV